jgi:leucyl aminopeptidase
MNIIAKRGKILEEKCDLLVLGVWAGTQGPQGLVKAVDCVLKGIITEVIADEEFGGKTAETLAVHTHGKLGANRVLIVGLGDKKDFCAETVRRAIAAAVRYADKVNATEIRSTLLANGLAASEASQAMTEGALLADYTYLNWKPKETRRLNKRGVVTLAIVEND